MPRILGINIPDNKKIQFALAYVYGVGDTTSVVVLRSAGIDLDKKAKDLTADELNKITKILEKSYRVEGDLRKEVSQNIKRLKEIGTWRGNRHARRLPIHGRSKTNSRTLRGNIRKTMGSGRKATGEKT
ncbi:MAG: 30S ribosomal protein S13 [Patescibacteria group bacterium]